MAYNLKIGRKTYPPVATLQEISLIYDTARAKLGLGTSRFPNGKVFEGGEQIAYVSFNGRVWAGTEYVVGAAPLYDNRDRPLKPETVERIARGIKKLNLF